MNASALFTIAHMMTRESVKRFGGDYRVTFAAALRIAHQERKRMNKQEFIESRVAEARAKCIGTRARAMFSADAVAAKAAEEWEFNNSPAQIERAARIAALEAKGGRVWVSEHGETRVYFNSVPVGTVGRAFDCYINIETGELHGAMTDEERAAAKSITSDTE